MEQHLISLLKNLVISAQGDSFNDPYSHFGALISFIDCQKLSIHEHDYHEGRKYQQYTEANPNVEPVVPIPEATPVQKFLYLDTRPRNLGPNVEMDCGRTQGPHAEAQMA